MKKIVLSVVLLTALLILLTACGVNDSNTPPQDTTIDSTTEPSADITASTSVNADTTASAPKYKRFTNYAFGKFGTGIPMFIRDTYLTPLAQAVADTADAGEAMYFLVYISDGNTDIDHAGYYNYLYQGKTIQEWNMEREAAIAARAEYENSLSNMTVGQIKLDEKYLQLSDKVDKADEQLSYAQAEWYFHTNKDSIAEHIKYFESFGFESFGDINDTEWQRRLYVANLASTCPIMFAVKGNTDNIEQLRQSNKEYCIILFASTGDGYWVEANDDLSYRPETYNLYYLYNIPEFWKNYIYYSYQELGLYERIWYIEE